MAPAITLLLSNMIFRLASIVLIIAAFFAAAQAQKTVVVIDPTIPVANIDAAATATNQVEIDRVALPKLKAKYESDACTVNLELAGEASGSFTKANAKETIAFYQVCQTGNGLGVVALVVTEGGKVTGIYASDSGWSFNIGSLPDINGNGLDELTLSFGGGMHQGQGGVGVEIVEFAGGLPKAIGWFQAEEFTDTEPTAAWRVTAKTGKTPVYYRQKFVSKDGKRWTRSGANAVFKLTEPDGTFEAVK